MHLSKQYKLESTVDAQFVVTIESPREEENVRQQPKTADTMTPQIIKTTHPKDCTQALVVQGRAIIFLRQSPVLFEEFFT